MKKLLLLCGLSLLMACFFSACENPEPDGPGQEQPENPDNPNNPNPDGPDEPNPDNPNPDNPNNPTPGDGPVVSLMPSEAVLEVPYNGGSFVFEYEVQKPVDGGTVSVVLTEGNSWVFNVKEIDPTSLSGSVSFNVAENTGAGVREAVFVVSYTYDESTVSSEMKVVQDVLPFEYEFIGVAGICRDWGELGGSYTYDIVLGDIDYSTNAPGGSYYILSFLGDNDSGDMLPRDGVYTVAQKGKTPGKGNIDPEYSYFIRLETEELVREIEIQPISGEVSIARDGEELIISGYIVDKSEYRHSIYYKGKPDAMEGGAETTFFEDVDMELPKMTATVESKGDLYESGSNIWIIKMFTEEILFGDPCVQIQLATDRDIKKVSKLAGVYTKDSGNAFSYNYDPGTFTPGKFGLQGTWLYHSAGVAGSGRVAIGDPAAPLKDGEIELVRNTDGTYNLIAEMTDDAGHSIRFTADNLKFE